MKKKISISIEEEMIERLKEALKNEDFRSRSHIIESVLAKYLEKEGDKNVRL
jgi:metal-responsive CopG/Arc/MetJ family transcriptional regulator